MAAGREGLWFKSLMDHPYHSRRLSSPRCCWIVVVRYEIEDGVLVLTVAVEGFAMLRDALDAAADDPRARPKMPVLFDVRNPASGHYEDVGWRVLILSQMRQQFAPRWAILTGTAPVPAGVGRMFALFSKIEALEVGIFADGDAAFAWLREPP